MKKIIHFSDLHIGYKNLSKKFSCIVENVIFVKEPAEEYIIVVTGDIVEKSTEPANYSEAKMYFKKLASAGFTVLVIPGNHDYGTSNTSSKKYVPIFKDTFYENTDIQYPKLDIIDNISFIGLDSMAEELHWYDSLFAEGEIGDEQLERLDSLLKENAVKTCSYRVLYLHHHPFDPWPLHQLKDSNSLGKVIMDNGNIDALLYGHNHAGKKRNGKWGIPRCYDAGSSTGKNRLGRHRVINLSRDPRFDYDADFHCEH